MVGRLSRGLVKGSAPDFSLTTWKRLSSPPVERVHMTGHGPETLLSLAVKVFWEVKSTARPRGKVS